METSPKRQGFAESLLSPEQRSFCLSHQHVGSVAELPALFHETYHKAARPRLEKSRGSLNTTSRTGCTTVVSSDRLHVGGIESIETSIQGVHAKKCMVITNMRQRA